MKIYPPHPAAELFEMMPDDQVAELAKDIKANGQREPIVLFKGQILDGRNRRVACDLAEVEPKYIEWTGQGSPVLYVLSKNLHRRHLNETQRALAVRDALKLLEVDGAARRKANLKRGAKGPDAAPGQDRGTSTAQAAVIAGVGERTVARAKSVGDRASAEDLKAMKSGKKTLKQVEKSLKRAAQLEEVKAYVPPAERYNVITVDFSWPYRDALDGKGMDRGLPYPPMTLEEIVAFIRGPLKNACDEEACVLGNWITGPISLDLTIAPVVQREIEALNFKPLHERIWEKEEKSGKDFTGLGRGLRWNAEKLQLYVRGNVVLNETGAAHGRPIQSTVFRAPVGANSEKPQRAYDDLEQLVPYTKRLEMFALKHRPGWAGSGSGLPAAEKVEKRITWREHKGEQRGKGSSGREYSVHGEPGAFYGRQKAFATSRAGPGMGGAGAFATMEEAQDWCEAQEAREHEAAPEPEVEPIVWKMRKLKIETVPDDGEGVVIASGLGGAIGGKGNGRRKYRIMQLADRTFRWEGNVAGQHCAGYFNLLADAKRAAEVDEVLCTRLTREGEARRAGAA